MSLDSIFIQGFAIGFLIAAPVGPLGMLCIQRTLAHGFLFGVLTGVGVALADAIYGMIAAFGLTVISDFLIAQRFILTLGGGLFLCWLGFLSLKSAFKKTAETVFNQQTSKFGAFSSAFLITITHPLTIISYIAIFSSNAIQINEPNHVSAMVMTSAIASGSMTWWLILSTFVTVIRKNVSKKWMRGINLASGILILAFGVYAIAMAFAI